MGIMKGFTFDGIESLTYGVGITGEAVYNAPTRDVEMFSIPGRNGEYALDHGRFNNIEVTYPAGYGDSNQSDFATNMINFRNALASRVGYCRLTDEYNPDEYRLAVYKSGLDVSPTHYSRAGQFDITFDCKPQRFLTSGETAVSKARNSTITNPTLFDSHPLLKFNSSGSDGSITLGSQVIKIYSAYLGDVGLVFSRNNPSPFNDTLTITNTSSYNTGDTITFGGASFTFDLSGSTSGVSATGSGLSATWKMTRNSRYTFTLTASDVTFTAGTSSTVTQTVDITMMRASNSETKTVTLTTAYSGSAITLTWTLPTFNNWSRSNSLNTADYHGTVNSTKNTLQNVDIYIDLDIGEAYSIDSSNNVVSLNNYVTLGGELPTLPPGNTTITYTTTISNFYITPRWWRI